MSSKAVSVFYLNVPLKYDISYEKLDLSQTISYILLLAQCSALSGYLFILDRERI